MGSTVRLRFVAFELVPPWIELQRKGPWRLAHTDRRGVLTISMFPLAQGITMNLVKLRAQNRQAGELQELAARRVPRRRRFVPRLFPLDEASWTVGCA